MSRILLIDAPIPNRSLDDQVLKAGNEAANTYVRKDMVVPKGGQRTRSKTENLAGWMFSVSLIYGLKFRSYAAGCNVLLRGVNASITGQKVVKG